MQAISQNNYIRNALFNREIMVLPA